MREACPEQIRSSAAVSDPGATEPPYGRHGDDPEFLEELVPNGIQRAPQGGIVEGTRPGSHTPEGFLLPAWTEMDTGAAFSGIGRHTCRPSAPPTPLPGA